MLKITRWGIISLLFVHSQMGLATPVNHLRDAKSVSCISIMSGEMFAMSFPNIEFSEHQVNYGPVKYFYLSSDWELRILDIPVEQQLKLAIGNVYVLQLLNNNWNPLAYMEYTDHLGILTTPRTVGDIDYLYRANLPNPDRFYCELDSEPINWDIVR